MESYMAVFSATCLRHGYRMAVGGVQHAFSSYHCLAKLHVKTFVWNAV